MNAPSEAVRFDGNWDLIDKIATSQPTVVPAVPDSKQLGLIVITVAFVDGPSGREPHMQWLVLPTRRSFEEFLDTATNPWVCVEAPRTAICRELSRPIEFDYT